VELYLLRYLTSWRGQGKLYLYVKIIFPDKFARVVTLPTCSIWYVAVSNLDEDTDCSNGLGAFPDFF
jgi:hypothetical protein